MLGWGRVFEILDRGLEKVIKTLRKVRKEAGLAGILRKKEHFKESQAQRLSDGACMKCSWE